MIARSKCAMRPDPRASPSPTPAHLVSCTHGPADLVVPRAVPCRHWVALQCRPGPADPSHGGFDAPRRPSPVRAP